MAKRRILIYVLIILLPATLCAFDRDSEMPGEEDISKALTVIVDCITSSLASQYASTTVELPCSSFSIDTNTLLPQRIAYFLADPSDFQRVIASALDMDGGNIFSTLFSAVRRSVNDPYLAAVSYMLGSRGYQMSDYLVSGSITFSYPEGTTFDTISGVLSRRIPSEDFSNVSLNLSLYGLRMDLPMYISGVFTVSVDEGGSIVVNSVDAYWINDYCFAGGSFRF